MEPKYCDFKGADYTHESDIKLTVAERAEMLYPYKLEHKEKFLMYALSGVGVRERIKLIDNAILNCMKL